MQSSWRTVLTLCVCALVLSAAAGPGRADATVACPANVAPQVWQATAGEQPVDFLVVLGAQADLSPAYALPTQQARGRWVYQTLWDTAQRSQAPLRAWFDARGVAYRPFYVANLIHVQAGDRALLSALSARRDVARIDANPRVRSVQPERLLPEPWALFAARDAALAVEWNVQQINADDVWALGVTGQGTVVGGQDTGYDWDHPALLGAYRGWDGSAASHDYNWHDAVHSGGGSCGADSPVPCDDYGHGTHTMGTMVGDDGAGNQVGVAPGAQWIGCRNMDRGYGTPATYLECFEFFLAPYPVGGTPAQGNPDLAPDVTNNSWTCPSSEGCNWDTLQAAVEAQRAAGIMTVVSAGNSGSSCSSVIDPPALYDAAYTVGATDSNDNIASFSGRGPVTRDGSGRAKPDISAPGVAVRSSVSGGGYGSSQGTSMAAPHVAAAVALLWSAQPALRGQIDRTEYLLNHTALPRYSTQCGDPAGGVPNNVYGWGRLDALAAVQQTLVGYLEGTVSAGGSGAPLAGAALRAISGTQVYSATAGAGGHYSLVLPQGAYTVSAWQYGYGLQSVPDLTVPGGVVTPLSLTLTSTLPYALSGCVVDDLTGAPLSATLSVLGPFGSPVTGTAVSAAGCYSLTLPGSPYTVTARARLHQPGLAEVDLITHTVQDFSLVPTTTYGLLLGSVVQSQAGLPLSGAAVRVTPGLTGTLSGPGGAYELLLPPGLYTVTVTLPPFSPLVEPAVPLLQSGVTERNYALVARYVLFIPVVRRTYAE